MAEKNKPAAGATQATRNAAAGQPSRNPAAKKEARKDASRPDRRAALREQQLAEARKARQSRMLKVAALVLAIAVIIVACVFAAKWVGDQMNKDVPPHSNADHTGIVVNGDNTKTGAPLVVLYSDFQCPYCKQLETHFGPKLLELAKSGDIRLEYRTLTLLDASIPGKYSASSALAAACTDKVNKMPEAYAALYALQPAKEGDGFPPDVLLNQLPSKLGLTGGDLDTYKSCFQSGQYNGFVANTNTAGQKALTALKGDQWGTPSMTVNGKFADFTPLHTDPQHNKVFDADPNQITVVIDQTK